MTSPGEPRWSPWRPLGGGYLFTPASLCETLDGGQSFRWRALPGTGAWQGVFGRHAVRVRLNGDGGLECCAATDPDAAAVALRDYLGMAAGLSSLVDRLPHRSDAVLRAALDDCPGLIVLRQPFEEALLGFLCSSTKRIAQIRQICDALARSLGEPLAPGIHALPTWEALASVGEPALRACALGFRARYVHDSARFITGRPGWLAHVQALPCPEARAALVQLPGVGEKVADCVLLYGGARLESFPVDVWILRTLQTRYGLEGWSPAQVAHFGRAHFGPLAGLAQQYLFAFERRAARRA